VSKQKTQKRTGSSKSFKGFGRKALRGVMQTSNRLFYLIDIIPQLPA
jgi:hypothetical protein